MPSKNRTKLYLEDNYYHLYNRGVNKQNIFCDENDFRFFLFLIETSLISPENAESIISKKYIMPYFPVNFSKELTVNCFVLMPNHFHLLIYQHNARTIEKFMQSLLTRYVKYFNKKYTRWLPLPG